uniref:GATOR1 complex protein NPRL3 C-terminal HTH domain-containing protein n=1 Tax=Acrobeloides nanus TaxID=290746 RepID=A0A914DBK2_9BILA
MLMFLLRNQLIIQLHTYFFLLPPFSTLALPNFDSSLLSARCRTLINERKEIDDEIKLNLIRICGELSNSGMSEMDIFWLLSSFISILPFLNGRHHFEDIMYTRQLDRTNARRLFDTFSPILATFCNQDFKAD